MPTINAPSDAASKDASAQSDEKYKSGGEAAIRAAFRSLARRDDRGNWARRFAYLTRIAQFVDADPEGLEVSTELQATGVRAALGEFVAAGYVTGGDRGPYDISHEALIRNWRDCQRWLIEPEDAAQALVQAVNFLGSSDPRDALSLAQARSLAFAVGDGRSVPKNWAQEQITPALSRSTVREKWGTLSGVELDNEEQLVAYILDYIDWARSLAYQESFTRYQNEYWHNEVDRISKRNRLVVIGFALALLGTWLSVLVSFVHGWLWI